MDVTQSYEHNSTLNTPVAYTHKDELIAIDSSVKPIIDPSAIILADAITYESIHWHIHNCKITKRQVTQDEPLPFLYHYDSLDDVVKQTYPLTPDLLAHFNRVMSAQDAATLIGIDDALISRPWHIKVVGSVVVFSEALQLAVRLQWTNTGKTTEQLYMQNKEDAIKAAFKAWQFFGRVDVLYKNSNQQLVSIDENGATDECVLILKASGDYQQLPAVHALAIITKLEANKDKLPWFETAILERIE